MIGTGHLEWLEPLVLGSYFGVLVILAGFGLHRLWLVGLYLRHRARTPPLPPSPEPWPRVTVQLPVYNERWVVSRLLDAVARLDYPRDRLQVQVLDDSDDGTREILARRVARLQGEGLDISHLCRGRRHGYKAGALEAGLARADGELVCVFDADFVPGPDFLRRTVPHFRDPEVGLVQARWEHLNREQSLLTRIQALFLDAHFAIEQAARNRSGRFFNFNGTAGLWRREAIREAGGWEHDTLTEDLDLSYRAQLAGWRFLYVDEPAAPAELPVSIGAFKSQQRRWTKGAVQTARKLLGRVWRSDAPARVKVEATFHMTANVAYPLMVALSVLVFPAVLVRFPGDLRTALVADLPILLSATGSVCVFFVVAQWAVGRSPLAAALRLPPLMALGIGISLNNTLAVLEGLGGDPGEFVRTPKNPAREPGGISSSSGYEVARDRLPWVEAIFGAYFSIAVVLAAAIGAWVSLPFLVLFQAGFLYVAWLSWRERPIAGVSRLLASRP